MSKVLWTHDEERWSRKRYHSRHDRLEKEMRTPTCKIFRQNQKPNRHVFRSGNTCNTRSREMEVHCCSAIIKGHNIRNRMTDKKKERRSYLNKKFLGDYYRGGYHRAQIRHYYINKRLNQRFIRTQLSF
jgi:hypothetical protein